MHAIDGIENTEYALEQQRNVDQLASAGRSAVGKRSGADGYGDGIGRAT
jgi:hypothetical protein